MRNSETRKWWVLAALSFGLLAVGLDMTVLNVALPTLASDLQASMGELQWFADSYNLVLAAALLPAGMLGDRFGRKRWLLIALVSFGAASLGCAYSGSTDMLIAMRALLGLGAAFLIPLSMSVLPVLFPDHSERTKATMIWGTANMLGIPLGPIVGGWLLKHYHWGAAFLINLPLVAVAIAAVVWLMPESRSAERRSIDPVGILCSSAGLVGITYGVIRFGEKGWDDALALAALASGLLTLSVFVLWERRSAHPLIDLSLFKSGPFTWGSTFATLITFAIFGLLFALPQYFQAVGGADTLQTGLRLLPLIGGLVAGAKLSDRLLTSVGYKVPITLGFAVLAAGLFIGSATDERTGYGFIAVWITVAGLGLGLSLPTSMASALNVLSAERSGVGSALLMSLRQTGGAIGVALLGSALNSGYRSWLKLDGLPAQAEETIKMSVTSGVAVAREIGAEDLLKNVQASFVHGMESMLLLCAGIALLGMIFAGICLPGRASASKKAGEAVH